MTRFAIAWCVRQALAFVLLLLTASGVSVAHPQLFFAQRLTPVLALAQTPSVNSHSQSEATPSSPAKVIMKGVRFQPTELTVRPGEVVEFENDDIFAHTVKADDGSFDSGLIQPGSAWKMTMPKATVTYHCVPHPNMKGKLVAAISAPSEGSGNAGHGLPGFNPPTHPFELHPILVNFTAALLPLALLSDLLGRFLKRPSLHHAAAWMVLYEALLTPLTAAAGWWWKTQSAGTLPAHVIAIHQWLGTSLALAFIVLAVWRWRIQKRGAVPDLAYLAFAVVTTLALIYQGSLGGLMVFGK